MTEFGLRIWDFGLREGVPLMRHKYLWGMCPGEFEKPVNVETVRPPEKASPKFGEVSPQATEGLYSRTSRK